MAASAIIDPAIVHRMLARLLEAVALANSKIKVIQLGEEWEGYSAWVRLESYRIRSRNRQRGQDEQQQADLYVEVMCGVDVGKSQVSSAISSLAGGVLAQFDGAFARDPVLTNPVVHALNLLVSEVRLLGTIDAEPGLQQALLTFEGNCERFSGTTMTDDL